MIMQQETKKNIVVKHIFCTALTHHNASLPKQQIAKEAMYFKKED
jgi:hypothetical protein